MLNFKNEYFTLEKGRLKYPTQFKDKSFLVVYGSKEGGVTGTELTAHIYKIPENYYEINAGQLDFSNYPNGIENDFLTIRVTNLDSLFSLPLNFTDWKDISPENLTTTFEKIGVSILDIQKRLSEVAVYIDSGKPDQINLPKLPVGCTWYKDQDENIVALPISELYSKFNIMMDNLKKILADYIEQKKEEIRGPAGAIDNVTASVNSNAGTPKVTVLLSGTPERRKIDLKFENLKGDKPIKGEDYLTPAEKEQFTNDTKAIVQAEGAKVIEQVKSIVAGSPETTNAITLSGKTRVEFEQDIKKVEDTLEKHFIFNFGLSETKYGYYNNSGIFNEDYSYISKIMRVEEGDLCCVTCSTPESIGFSMCIFYDIDMKVIKTIYPNSDATSKTYVDEIVKTPKNSKFITVTSRIQKEIKLGKTSFKQIGRSLVNKTIVNLGDSIFGNNNSLTGVSSLISQETGANVINCAFGGTKMVIRDGEPSGYEQFDFGNLLKSIISKDFTDQNDAVNWYSLPEYYRGRLETLRYIDFSKIDIVTLNFSTNDYTFGVPRNTLKQAYIKAVSDFQKAYPNLLVIIISPTWRCWLNEDKTFKEDSNTKIWWSQGDSTLIDYCNTLQEVSKELNIKYIDVYNIGINKNTWDYYFTTVDTTHQNENGRRLLAKVISNNIF